MGSDSRHQLSVLIPTFNAEWCIADALTSILRWQPGHCLGSIYIADDASVDDTISVARSIWRGGVPLRVLKSDKNIGEGANINRAMLTLQDDGVQWALLLHQDDLVIGPWMELVIGYLASAAPNLGMLCCHSAYRHVGTELMIDPGGQALRPHRGYIEHLAGDASVRSLRRRWFWTVSGSVFRVAAYNHVGGFHPSLPYAGDNDFLVRLFLADWAAVESDGTYIVKRHHAASQTSRTERDGTDILAWCYLMQRYLPYASRLDRSREYLERMAVVLRRVLARIARRDWRDAYIQVRNIAYLARSYTALMSGIEWMAPRYTRSYLLEAPPLVLNGHCQDIGESASTADTKAVHA